MGLCQQHGKIKKKNSVLLFRLLFSTDICGLEAMLNPLENVVATSDSDSENELVSLSGQLLSEVSTPLTTAVFKSSSDTHIASRLQYHGPVTVQQYITVKRKDSVGSEAENPSKDPDTISLQQPEGANPVGM